MLSWDEFDKEDAGDAIAAAAKPAAPVIEASLDKLDNEAAGSVEKARAINASDSAAVARAKASLNELDIQEGLDELAGMAHGGAKLVEFMGETCPSVSY